MSKNYYNHNMNDFNRRSDAYNNSNQSGTHAYNDSFGQRRNESGFRNVHSTSSTSK